MFAIFHRPHCSLLSCHRGLIVYIPCLTTECITLTTLRLVFVETFGSEGPMRSDKRSGVLVSVCIDFICLLHKTYRFTNNNTLVNILYTFYRANSFLQMNLFIAKFLYPKPTITAILPSLDKNRPGIKAGQQSDSAKEPLPSGLCRAGVVSTGRWEGAVDVNESDESRTRKMWVRTPSEMV